MACCESDSSSEASSISDVSNPSSCGGEHSVRQAVRKNVAKGNGIMDLFGVQMEVRFPQFVISQSFFPDFPQHVG